MVYYDNSKLKNTHRRTKMRSFRAFLALLLAALCGISTASAARYEPFDHPDVPFSEMTYTGVDVDAVDDFCARFAQDPVGQYPALLALYDAAYTQYNLAYIRMCQNAGSDAPAAESERAETDFIRASDAIERALGEALRGEQGAALRALMPEGEADDFAEYTGSTEEELDADAAETALVNRYYRLPDDERFADDAAELYLQLAALRRAEARRAGFDSYPEYAYVSFFSREYTPQEMQRLQSVVKTQIAPLYARCIQYLDLVNPVWDDDDIPTDDEVLDALGARIGDVSPELNEAFDFLLRNKLYCIGSGDELLYMGYTTLLPAYGSVFLYNKVSSRFEAFQSTVHEFGHFNAMYHDPTPILYQHDNMDVSEIQSQALELLFLPSLQDILAGDRAADRDVVTLYALEAMLSSVVKGCLYDEFEQTVYAHPDMTVQELHELEQTLYAAYGLEGLFSDEPYWVSIPHLFSDPCYYISYAVSALPALDVWLRSLDDYDAAVDAYLNVSAARTDAWFFDVVYDNGLCDVTDRGDVARLAEDLTRQMDALTGKRPAVRAPAGVYLAEAAAAAAVVCGTVFLLRRKRE